MMKTGLVIPYFGKWPDYLPFYLASVRCNHELEVLFFTDLPVPAGAPPNVRFVRCTLGEFSDLASETLGLDIRVENAYKLCDFRPAYGVIFQRFLDDYAYWGFGDIDVIYGNVSSWLRTLVRKSDVISFRRCWVSGSLAVFRNTPEVNNLWRRSRDWRRVLRSPDYMGFDEAGGRVFKELVGGADINALDTPVKSLTHVLRREQRLGNTKCHFEDLACESLTWSDTLCFEDGLLRNLRSGKEHPYFHFVIHKRRYFYVPKWPSVPNRYYIRHSGIYSEREWAPIRACREVKRVGVGAAICAKRLPARWRQRITSGLSRLRQSSRQRGER